MDWRMVRRGNTAADVIKALIEAEQRQNAESGIEDTEELWTSRIDYDAIDMVGSYEKPKVEKMGALALQTLMSFKDRSHVVGNYKACNNYGWVEHDNHKLKIDFQDGKNALDVTERNLPGTITGVVFVEGPLPFSDYAASFDGVDDKITIPDNAVLRIAGGQNFSIALWLKTTDSNLQRDIVVKANADWWLMRLGNASVAGVIRLQLYDGVASAISDSSITVNDGIRHHIACTYTASTGRVKVYIDGVDRTSVISDRANQAIVNTAIVRIAEGQLSGGFLPCEIMDLNIFDIALTQDQVKTIMARGQLEQPIRAKMFEAEVLA